MEARMIKEKGEEGADPIKAIKREVAHIFSKGTHVKLATENTLADFDTKYVLTFYQSKTKFGYCYFDMSTLKFQLGNFTDDFTLKKFRTLVMQIRPVEFVCTSGADNH